MILHSAENPAKQHSQIKLKETAHGIETCFPLLQTAQNQAASEGSAVYNTN